MASVFRKKEISQNKSKISSEVDILKDDDQVYNPYTEIQILSGHADIVKLLVIVDEERFISISDDSNAIIWNIKTGCKMMTLSGHCQPILCCVTIPSVMHSPAYCGLIMILTGSADKTIRMWNADTGKCTHVITEHNCSAKALVTLDHLQLFCAGGHDIFMWNVSGQLQHSLKLTEEADISHLLQITDERMVVAAGRSLQVLHIISIPDESGLVKYQLERMKRLQPFHREIITCMAHIADAFFASASLDGAILLWNTNMLSASRKFNIVEQSQGCYPCSVQYILSVEERFLIAAIGCGFSIFDIVTGTCLKEKKQAHHLKVVQLKLVHKRDFCQGCMMHDLLALSKIASDESKSPSIKCPRQSHKLPCYVLRCRSTEFQGQIARLFLATCSQDGTIRLWGNLSHHSQLPLVNQGTASTNQRVLTRFFNTSLLQPTENDMSHQCSLLLLGELLGHSGAIQMIMELGNDGLASCGVDGLVIIWKDGGMQTARRNELIQETMLVC